LIELWKGSALSASTGLSALDGAMAMAAAHQRMAAMKRMIALGADPSAMNFLAYRMAALAGDLQAMSAIEAVASPSAYALNDAIRWAHENDRWEVVLHLRSRLAKPAT